MMGLPFTRAAAVATGALLGIVAGITLADGRFAALVVAVVVALGVTAAAWRYAPRGDHAWLAAAVLFAFALRAAVAVVLQTGLEAIAREGLTGDDGEYARLAWGYAQYVRDQPQPPYVPPYWNSSAYLFGTYVYLVTGLFLVFGPEVLIPDVLNAGFGALTLVFLFHIARRLFGRGPAVLAASLIAVYPSIVLWSAINLKDALALLVISAMLWAILRYGDLHRPWPLGVAYLLLWPMESLRRYIFAGMALMIPLAIAVMPRIPARSRLRWGAAASALSAVLLAFSPVTGLLHADSLLTLEFIRVGMSQNARTGFVERPPVIVEEGDTFVVPGTPRVNATTVIVPPGARVVVEPPDATLRTRTPVPFQAPEIVVRPGDVVVVGGPSVTAAPTEQRQALRADGVTQLRSAQAPEENVAIRTIAYLPKGLTYAVLAPFPWDTRRAADALAAVEMLAWYVMFAAAVWTTWSERARWRELMPLTAFVAGLLFVFALVEGNVGTLFRHRGMIVPTVAILAAPTLVTLARRAPRSAPARALARMLSTRSVDRAASL